jgi:hypothetical protein
MENHTYDILITRDDFYYFAGLYGLRNDNLPPKELQRWETTKKYSNKKLNLYERIIQLCTEINKDDPVTTAAYLDYANRTISQWNNLITYQNVYASEKMRDRYLQDKKTEETNCYYTLTASTQSLTLRREIGYANCAMDAPEYISQEYKNIENLNWRSLNDTGCDPTILYGLYIVINDQFPTEKELPELARNAAKHYSRYPQIYKDFIRRNDAPNMFRTDNNIDYAEKIIKQLDKLRMIVTWAQK